MDIDAILEIAERLNETAPDPLNWGPVWALLGAFLAAALGGIGSALGTQAIGKAAAGVISEKPETSGGLIALTALPSSQAIYGLVGAFIAGNLPLFELDLAQGFAVFTACMPVAVAALFSGIFQGKVGAAGANIVAKGQGVGSPILLAAMVETVAILGLLVSIILLGNIGTAVGA
jgi:V/A-type H+-transporting ATPase subunit K